MGLMGNETQLVANVLFEAIKLRDLATSQHSALVAHYSYALAEIFDSKNKDAYVLGGLIHDVGKIAMDDDVLKSSRRLSDEERVSLRTHVILGAEVLDLFGVSGIPYDMTRFHHEREDGSGYCFGYKGDQIPLAGKISAIADTFSALVENRKYQCAVGKQEAIKVMKSQGRAYDGELLNRFEQYVLEEDKLTYMSPLLRNLEFRGRLRVLS